MSQTELQHLLHLQNPCYKEQLERCLVLSPVLCCVEQMVYQWTVCLKPLKPHEE